MNSTGFRPYTLVVTAAWVAIILGLMLINIRKIHDDQHTMAVLDARVHVKKDNAFRFWVASHGGVYVPVTDRVQPNPYLSRIPERDLVTPSGRLLTLINSAYMLRLVAADFDDPTGIRTHLSGFTPARNETTPDEWEKAALEKFQLGAQEVTEITTINGISYLRIMEPMYFEKRCSKCHANENYAVGAVRGGVSVSVPMSPYFARMKKEIALCVACYGVVLVIGLAGISLGRNRLIHHIRERDKTEDALRSRTVELEKANKELRQVPARLIATQEEERKRIAAELHDSIGQTFAAVKFWIEMTLEYRSAGDGSAAFNRLEQLVPTLQQAIQETRSICMGLRPPMLDGTGLLTALEWLRQECMKFYPSRHIELETGITEEEIPQNLKPTIFRIVQEALNNVGKHSNADWVDISVSKDDGGIALVVSDDGIGLDMGMVLQNGADKTLGLTTMRERTELLGGSFTIESASGGGTTIRAWWPGTASA